jgi:plasmid stabilization system protein ParE
MLTLKRRGQLKSSDGSSVSTPALPGRFPGPKRGAASTQQPDVAREIEYLEEALEETEAAARWYAERSAAAAIAFSEEIDAAESAILRLPEAWPRYDQSTHRYLLRRFPFSVVYRVETNRILIVAVAHGRRRPGYWRSRV